MSTFNVIGRPRPWHHPTRPAAGRGAGGNKLKHVLREGKMAIGLFPPFQTPHAVEFVGLAGFDFVFIDGEHTALTPLACTDLVRAANVALRDQGYLFTLNSGGALLAGACRALLEGIRSTA